jgi:hypothetical protein
LDEYRTQLEELVATGNKLAAALRLRVLRRSPRTAKVLESLERKSVKAETLEHRFSEEYQRWYTLGTALVTQLLPDRLSEFRSLYLADAKRKEVSVVTYSIQDWLLGIVSAGRFDEVGVVVGRFEAQLAIVTAAQLRFESKLFDIENLVRADLLDSEVDAARELIRSGFLRAAGVVCGVVLEKHLAQVCANHHLPVTKRHPTIGDLNDLLKNNSVYDVTIWRNIQRLGDLRNLCGHERGREPTKDDALELVSGVDKTMKTVL